MKKFFTTLIIFAAVAITIGLFSNTASATEICCREPDSGDIITMDALCEDLTTPMWTVDGADTDECGDSLPKGVECCCEQDPDPESILCLDGGFIGEVTITCGSVPGDYESASDDECAAGNTLCCCEESGDNPGQCSPFGVPFRVSGTIHTACGEVSDSYIDTNMSECSYTPYPMGGDPTSFDPPLPASLTLKDLTINVTRALIGLLGLAAVVMMIYGGYLYIFSAKGMIGTGDQKKKIEHGKRTMLWALIGLIVILMSFSIISYLVRALNWAS